MFKYIQGTNEDLSVPVNDNDLSAYVKLINRHEGHTDYDNLPMDVKDLKSSTMIDVANPFVFYAAFTMVKTYLLLLS